jgi:hypothetical protein
LFLVLNDGSVDERNAISREAIQAAITEVVKKADPGCEPFLGVIVRRTNPKSRLEANWAIRGINSGRADRNKASGAVTA